MPYKSREDLPQNVRNVLPEHAQDIYLSTYNNAWHEYKNPHTRRNNETLEEVSHRVAWAAVKHSYKKGSDGKWYRLP